MAELENKIENTEAENQAAESEENKAGKFYTPEEIAMIEQKAGDKRVSQYQKTLDKRNREADKLSKMSADERYAYELEQRERAIEEKEQQLTLAENKNAVAKILAEKGISLSLVDFCVDIDADVMNEKIKVLDKAFKASVKAEVEKRLSSNTPKRAIDTDEGITPEQFRKMSLAQQSQLFKESPDIYNAIVSQLKH